MAANFNVQDYPQGKMIRFNSSYTRVRTMKWIYALSYLVGAVGFVYLAIVAADSNVFAFIFTLVFVVAYLIAGYRFLDNATETERLFISQESLDIIVSSLVKSRRRSFPLADISDFTFLEKETYAPHPLKGDTMDYLGFQTQQQVIQDLYSEGRASFTYQGRQVRFGKKLSSWEFEELRGLLYVFTENEKCFWQRGKPNAQAPFTYRANEA